MNTRHWIGTLVARAAVLLQSEPPAVPEPGTLLLLGVGLESLGVAPVRRRA